MHNIFLSLIIIFLLVVLICKNKKETTVGLYTSGADLRSKSTFTEPSQGAGK